MLNNIGEACTACRACEQICPNSAIIFEKDEYGNIYPQVLEDKCTWCGLCNSVCHVQNTVSLHTITKYYAGFSNDEDRKIVHPAEFAQQFIRWDSKKGIRSLELYRKKIFKQNILKFGVVWT